MKEILVFGAGALSLGFLAPELSKDYQITLVDRDCQGNFLDYLSREHRYRINLSFPTPKVIKINNISGLNLDNPEQRDQIIHKISRVPLIFTAAGLSNLKSVASILAQGIKRGRSRDKNNLFILCCENGWQVETVMENHLREYIPDLPSWVHLGSPVVGRMCRYDKEVKEKRRFQSVADNFDWAVVAEPWYGIPVMKSGVSDENELFYGRAFQLKEPKEFVALKRMKLLLHNGTHALLSYLGYLKEYSYFYQLIREKELLRLVDEMIHNEIIPALLSSYGDVLGKSEINNYAISVLRRILCPVFRDSLDRGIRGSLKKLKPEERLISGARFIVSAGYLPRVYCLIIAAAIKINQNQGKLSGSLEDILLDHCQLQLDQDKKIIELIKKRG